MPQTAMNLGTSLARNKTRQHTTASNALVIRDAEVAQMVMAIFPFAFPASRWRMASGASTNG